MKKLFFLLCVIGTTVMMTSCLERENRYDDAGFVYIATSTEVTPEVNFGRVFSRAAGARLITNRHIQDGSITQSGIPVPLRPGNFYFFAFRWEEANGTTPISEHLHADNANIDSDVITIPGGDLSFVPVAEGTPLPEHAFLGVNPIIFFNDANWWNDHWIFEYGYLGGENPPIIQFHKREVAPEDIHSSFTEINIDVRISDGFQPGTSPRGRAHATALNVAELRNAFVDKTRELRVTFHYYSRVFRGDELTDEVRAEKNMHPIHFILREN